MSKHDRVRSYNFKDCIEVNRTEICQICNKNKAIITDSEYDLDRKGIWIYHFINYCTECWEMKIEKDKIEEQKRKDEKLKRNLEKEKLEKLLKTLEYKPISLRHAIVKFREQITTDNSNKWIMDNIVKSFKNLLLIKKVRNRWYCCQNRLNLIDFKLYSENF